MSHLLSFAVTLAAILFSAVAAQAQDSNTLSDAEIQGRALAEKILSQRPVDNFTNTGVLEIRDGDGRRTQLPVVCETIVTDTDWLNRYEAGSATNANGLVTLIVTHAGLEPNHYLIYENNREARVSHGQIHVGMSVVGNRTATPFAGSDFWVCDLGLEFFHWPQQKVLKKEFHRQCPCTVLESTNPDPATNAYSRVVSWIDNNSLGIVEADAYDVNGRKLKNFYPKDIEKVNGQYRVGSMVMENLQTGSKSVMKFDLDQ